MEETGDNTHGGEREVITLMKERGDNTHEGER